MVTPTRIAIAAAIVMGLFAVGYARPHSAPMRNFAERHFDHNAHAKAITAKGGTVPACAKCHPTDPKSPAASKLIDNDDAYSVQDHAFCSGQGCHSSGGKFGDTTQCTELDHRDQSKVCVLCHLTKCGAVMPPNEAMTSRFAHGRHADNAAIADQCVLCHKTEAAIAPGPAKFSAHESCGATVCHGGTSKPTMSDCASCHTGPTAKSAKSSFRVTFNHVPHAKLSNETKCIACHRKPTSAAADALLLPQMLDCQNACHNGQPRVGGKPVFSTVGTQCTKCHVNSEPALKARIDLQFLHTEHEKRNVKIADCASCHTLKPDGELAGPGIGKDHMPCAASGCHQTEFASKTTKICGVCHEQTAPWIKNQSRPGPIANHEWYEGMNHAAHLKSGAANATCTSCHGDKLANAAKPRGHAPCAQCHAKGQAPAMTECAACHTRTAPAHAPVSQWAVTGNFNHTSHATDPRSNQGTKCVECHASIGKAKDLTAQLLPAMATCEGCHDGKTMSKGKPVFKATGFDCARCHLKQDKPAPVASIP